MKEKQSGYLMINRTIGETFVINEEIEITIQRLSGKTAYISIKAPKDIKIRRKEVLPKEA